MKKQKGFTLIELILVAVIIGILMTTGLKYYVDILNDARRAGLSMLSGRFAAAVSGVHLQWVIQHHPPVVNLDGYRLQMSDRGWPVAERSAVGHTRLNSCQQLWQSLLQNPAPLPGILPEEAGGIQYWAGVPLKGVCRYHLIAEGSQKYYFDYFLSNGKVRSRSTKRQ